MSNDQEFKNLTLAGGKGGGGSAFSQEDDTLRANEFVTTLEALGYGPIVGLVNGSQSVYIDDTPLQNSQHAENFKGITWDARTGTPDQTAISGFEAVTTPVAVATDVTVAGGPVVRTLSTTGLAAVDVTIKLPDGLYNNDTGSNTLKKTTVEFSIAYAEIGTGTWVTAFTKKYNDKATTSYEETFRVNLPDTTKRYDVKVARITADNSDATIRNKTQWAFLSEVRKEVVTYPNIALVGIGLDAAGVNANRIPVRRFEVYGRIVQVPNNFDARLRTYTGIWDLATFKNSWTDDPAWVLYDLLTEPNVGLGLDAGQIDVVSFYEASLYNSAWLPFTNTSAADKHRPRYSFNGSIDSSKTAIEWIKAICTVMNATPVWVGGQISLIQDRPTEYSHVFTNANVIDGSFTRSGSPDDTRFTVANVTWSDPAQSYKPTVTTVQDDGAVAIYGAQVTQVAAFGITNEPQAIRYGRYILDTSLNTTGSIKFATGAAGAGVMPGDVIRVFDNTFIGVNGAGRLKAGSTTVELQLDRSVTLTAGSTVTIWGQDGTIHTDLPVSGTGATTTLTLTTPMAAAPAEYSIYHVTTSSMTPELYRVASRETNNDGTFNITAHEYDEQKYARVDGNVTLVASPYPKRSVLVAAPSNLGFSERSITTSLITKRFVDISWSSSSPADTVNSYRVTYSLNGGAKIVSDVRLPALSLEVTQGSLWVMVQAISSAGYPSQPTTGSYEIAYVEDTGSALDAPTNLYVINTTGTTFASNDLQVSWVNPLSNANKTHITARFKVEVYTGATLLRTSYVAGVNVGQQQTYTYTFENNVADGGPRRTITIKVYAQDASLKLSAATTAVFTNPQPAVPSSTAATGGIGQVFFTCSQPTDTDYKGTMVWASLTSGFTPGAGNLVYDGSDSVKTFKQLGPGTHYIKAAHYDTFSKDTAGTGHNLTTQLTATPLASAGIPQGTTNPAAGAEGDLFFNTTSGKLFRYHSGAWTAAVPTVDLTGTVTTAQIADAAISTAKFASGIEPVTNVTSVPGTKSTNTVFNSTDGKLYRWNGTAYVPTTASTDITGTLTNSQLADIAAAKVTGQIVGTQITDGAISTAKLDAGAVTAAKIAANTITANNIAAGTITAAQIATDAITSAQIAANAVTASELAANSVVAGKIAASAVSTNELAANAVTAAKIAVGTITANEIAAGTITAAQIATDTITSAQIAANAITASELAANSVVAGKVAASAISTNELAANAVTAAKIATNTITANEIATNLLSADNVLTRSITVRDPSSGAVIFGSGVDLDWDNVTGNKPVQYQVFSKGLSATSAPSGITVGVVNLDTGATVSAGARSYSLTLFNRSTGAVVSSATYDVYSSSANATALATALNAATADQLVVLTTYDEPYTNHTAGGLPDAIYRCGGSSMVFGSSNFKARGAYVLIGIGGCGAGNGFEAYAGDVTNDANAWVLATMTYQNGNFNISGSASKVRTIGDYGYTGDLDASSDISLAATNMTLSGNNATKTGGVSNSWDAQVCSKNGYVGGAAASYTVDSTSSIVMFGLNTDPLSSSNYTSLDFAFYQNGTSTLYIYESGTLRGSMGTIAVGDVLTVLYDGSNVKYYVNGTVVRTVAATVDGALYLDSSVFKVGNTISKMSFGPLTSTSWNDLGNKPADTDLLNTHTQGSIGVVNHPAGGSFSNNTANVTGAIKIALPVSWTSTMMRFYVEIFNFATNGTSTYEIGGYNYATSTTWHNTYAKMVGGSASERAVRFGHDGTKCCIWIGEPTTVWQFPQVSVTNVRAAYSNFATSTWAAGWAVSLDTSAVAGHNIQSTITNPLTGANWGEVSGTGRPEDFATVGADWDTNMTNIPYEEVFNNDDAVAYGFNPTFSWPTGSYPTGWSAWNAAPVKETTLVRVGAEAVKFVCTGSNAGMTRSAGFTTAPLPAGTYLAGTTDIYLAAYTSGKPGLLVRLFTNSALTTFADTHVTPPQTATGVWQRVPWSARVASGQQIYGIQIYVMGSWTSMTGGAFTGTVVFDNLRFALNDTTTDNKALTISETSGVITIPGAGGGSVTTVTANNKITAGNATTYIASAAIGDAQINTISANKISATSLSAITATIGTLRTATTGARTEIKDNVIKVYDASNVLRVQIGDLSL